MVFPKEATIPLWLFLRQAKRISGARRPAQCVPHIWSHASLCGQELPEESVANIEVRDRRFDNEVRFCHVALGEEDAHRIDSTFLDSELASLSVQIHGPRQHGMNTAKVDGEVPIDEHKNVVVAREGERLAAVVAKSGGDFDGKGVVVRLALVAEELVVDGKKRGVAVGIHAFIGI